MKRPGTTSTLHLVGDRVATGPRALPGVDTGPRLRMARGPRSVSAKLVQEVYDQAVPPRVDGGAAGSSAGVPTPAAGQGPSAFDPRWVLAVRVNYALDGGRAAILDPQSRAMLIDLAKLLGLRPFDANLIIAIVQDSKRQTGDGLTPDTRARLGLLPDPARAAARGNIIGYTIGVLLTAAIVAWVASRWFVGG